VVGTDAIAVGHEDVTAVAGEQIPFYLTPASTDDYIEYSTGAALVLLRK
jgi:hypothetical protein